MNEISVALRALRDAFRKAGVTYDHTGYYNIALMPTQRAALKAEPDYQEFVDQEELYFLYFDGFRIEPLERLHA